MNNGLGWIGVDLDGTLAEYSCREGSHRIGAPVPPMLQRVKNWLTENRDVRIFTARVGPQGDIKAVAQRREEIRTWCIEHLGRALPVTATKDITMAELWDDRCVQVVHNTGRRVDGLDGADSEDREIIRSAFAKLLSDPLPTTARDYRRALTTAALMGRQMEDEDFGSNPRRTEPKKTMPRFSTLRNLFNGHRKAQSS